MGSCAMTEIYLGYVNEACKTTPNIALMVDMFGVS